MQIPALVFVSISEVQVVKPFVTPDWIADNRDEFYKYLYDLGIDTKKFVDKQEGIFHRNRLNKVVFGDRYLGYERTDKAWLDSGYATQEAKDSAVDSKLLEDLYKRKGYSL